MTSSQRRRRTLLLLALVALAAHSFALVGLLPGALPATGDTLGAFVPWHEFARRAFWERGEMPLWNPHLYCGVPFMGNGQSGLLYPPNLIFRLLPESLALWLFAYGHTLFLMVGGYFLGRTLGLKRRAAFVVGVLLGLGGANPAHLFGGHLTFLPVRSYWPWEAAFLLRLLRGQGRGNAVFLAACIALALTAGAPQLWLFGLLICGGIFLVWCSSIVLGARERTVDEWRQARIPLLLAAILTTLWCAPVLLPLHELRDWSSHGDSLTFAQVTDISATFRSLFRLLFDDFFGGNSIYMWSLRSNAGEDAASLGLGAFLLAFLAPFCARKSRAVPALFAFCVLMMLLALGDATPLYRLLYDHVALFQNTRVPARWLELWAFGVALLAGYAFDGLLTNPQRIVLVKRTFGIASRACLLLLFGILVTWAPWHGGAHIIILATGLPVERASAIARGLQAEAFLSCLLSGVCVGVFAWCLRGGLSRGIGNPLLIVLLFATPLGVFWHSTRIAPPRHVAEARLPQSLAMNYQSGRWIVRAPFGRLNAPFTAGVDALNGYEPFGSAPFFEFATAAQPGARFSADFQPERMAPLWRVAGVSHLLWQPKFYGDAPRDFPGVDTPADGLWNLRQLDDGLKAWPRAYLASGSKVVPAQKRFEVLKQLAKTPFSSSIPVVVEADFPPLEKRAGGSLILTPQVATPDILSWNLSTPRNTIFVHHAVLAPGWSAYVDNRRVPVYRVNGIFQGVPVPAGAQKIALVYDSQTFRFALFLALCGLGLATSLWFGSRRVK